MEQNPAPNAHLGQVLERFRTQPVNILQTLLAVQHAVGYVPPDSIAEIARSLDVTEADVTGVLSFYPYLRTRPVGRHVIRVCFGESCFANQGGRALIAFRHHLKIDLGETTPDGRFTLERVYCLGNCAVAPTVVVDDQLYGRVMSAEVLTILDKYE